MKGTMLASCLPSSAPHLRAYAPPHQQRTPRRTRHSALPARHSLPATQQPWETDPTDRYSVVGAMWCLLDRSCLTDHASRAWHAIDSDHTSPRPPSLFSYLTPRHRRAAPPQRNASSGNYEYDAGAAVVRWVGGRGHRAGLDGRRRVGGKAGVAGAGREGRRVGGLLRSPMRAAAARVGADGACTRRPPPRRGAGDRSFVPKVRRHTAAMHMRRAYDLTVQTCAADLLATCCAIANRRFGKVEKIDMKTDSCLRIEDVCPSPSRGTCLPPRFKASSLYDTAGCGGGTPVRLPPPRLTAVGLRVAAPPAVDCVASIGQAGSRSRSNVALVAAGGTACRRTLKQATPTPCDCLGA
eukprot:356243-Chlamydomonas_euryale.AAC.2